MLGLTIEEADAIIGKPMGIPKTGVFGLIDLGGLDLMPHINASLAKRCRRRRVPRGESRPAADQENDRRGLYRPQGQGRLLPLNRAGGAKTRRPSI
jgi:3-hydroxyacyl-CoA dehydrogenase